MTPAMQEVRSALLTDPGLSGNELWLAVAENWQEEAAGLFVLLNSINPGYARKRISDLADTHGVAVKFLLLPECFQEGSRLDDGRISLCALEDATLEELAEGLERLMWRFALPGVELLLHNDAPEVREMALILKLEPSHCAEPGGMIRQLRGQVAGAIAESPMARQWNQC